MAKTARTHASDGDSGAERSACGSSADHLRFMREAINEARKGLDTGGIPIGSVLVREGQIVGRGHNRRVQKGSPILHAEMDCLENAGRLKAQDYRQCVIYSTLSPCSMCTGAILLYKIPIVVIGENSTFKGPESYSSGEGVEIVNLDLDECKDMMRAFIEAHPELWFEDIGT
jgi:cytosine/creatinine deaminase